MVVQIIFRATPVSQSFQNTRVFVNKIASVGMDFLLMFEGNTVGGRGRGEGGGECEFIRGLAKPSHL